MMILNLGVKEEKMFTPKSYITHKNEMIMSKKNRKNGKFTYIWLVNF